MLVSAFVSGTVSFQRLLHHGKSPTNSQTDWVFCSGSGMLSTSIGLNAVSTHGACTAVFVAVAAMASFGLASIRTLGKMTWVAWSGLVSVFIAGQ